METGMKFSVVDKTTGEPAEAKKYAHNIPENLCPDFYTRGFAMTEKGDLIVCNEANQFGWVDNEEEENLKIVFEEETNAKI
jgi:hypothetical protein